MLIVCPAVFISRQRILIVYSNRGVVLPGPKQLTPIMSMIIQSVFLMAFQFPGHEKSFQNSIDQESCTCMIFKELIEKGMSNLCDPSLLY